MSIDNAGRVVSFSPRMTELGKRLTQATVSWCLDIGQENESFVCQYHDDGDKTVIIPVRDCVFIS